MLVSRLVKKGVANSYGLGGHRVIAVFSTEEARNNDEGNQL